MRTPTLTMSQVAGGAREVDTDAPTLRIALQHESTMVNQWRLTDAGRHTRLSPLDRMGRAGGMILVQTGEERLALQDGMVRTSGVMLAQRGGERKGGESTEPTLLTAAPGGHTLARKEKTTSAGLMKEEL